MKSFCQVFSTNYDLCSAGQFMKHKIFTTFSENVVREERVERDDS